MVFFDLSSSQMNIHLIKFRLFLFKLVLSWAKPIQAVLFDGFIEVKIKFLWLDLLMLR